MRILLLSSMLILPAGAQFKAVDQNGRLEIRDGDKLVFAYQHEPLAEPKGGEKFAASAFIHPLTTPSGFVLTDMQPDDHLHHLGVWWPWKLVKIGGDKFVTWELQQGEGRHRGDIAGIVKADADEVQMNARNLVEISRDAKSYEPVIEERATLHFARHGKDGYQLDIDLAQHPVEGVDPVIQKYRYSGFAWRGTPEWTGENSTMLSSGGHHRDNANHQPAKWCLVSGDTPGGEATMLILSAADTPERLRVWGSNMHHGNPFVNFNPVVKKSLKLKEANKPVSHRRYRLIMVDREIKADEADKLWNEWMKGL
ncbi:MAG: DUF6807 family protein [Akkermansiaceae bacterium]|nr:DUF6807 family protein [Akkermansiaceae bacterium]